MFGGDADRRVHEAKAGFEMQGEKSAERVGLGQAIRRPVVAERAVASTRDAADVAQPSGIDISRSRKRPRAALRPARHAEFAIAQRVGDRRQVVGPAGIAASLLRAGLSDPRTVDADEAQPVLRCRLREQPRFEPAARSAVVMDDERSVRVANVDIRERATVRCCPGCFAVVLTCSALPLTYVRRAIRSPASPRRRAALRRARRPHGCRDSARPSASTSPGGTGRSAAPRKNATFTYFVNTWTPRNQVLSSPTAP